MKLPYPLLAALGLALTWTALLISVPSVLVLFADFKMPAPPLTLVWLWCYGLLKGLALPLFVLATALLLGFRLRLGWAFALVLCVGCDLGFFGLLLPIVELVNNMSDGGEALPISPSTPLVPSFEWAPVRLGWGMVLALSSFLLNQVLLVSLIIKRREFAR